MCRRRAGESEDGKEGLAVAGSGFRAVFISASAVRICFGPALQLFQPQFFVLSIVDVVVAVVVVIIV